MLHTKEVSLAAAKNFLSFNRNIVTKIANIMSTNAAPAASVKYGEGSQPFTVLVEGNIGSGKTTYLDHLKKFDDHICLLPEPIENWCNFNGDNLLGLMYKNPERWAFPFQTYVTLTMLKSHVQPTEKPLKIMERSIYSAKNCFVENMHRNGILPDAMYNILKEWYEFLEEKIHIQADLIIYLRTSPHIVYERMCKRARSEETCVPLKYLQELHELHDNWLLNNRAENEPKVLVLDGDLSFENIRTEYKRIELSIFDAMPKVHLQQPVLISPKK